MTTDNSSTPSRPAKPSPDFPLFPHRSGYWARKVHGRFIYFGKWSEVSAADALRSYEQWQEDQSDRPSVLTLKQLCGAFLESKRQLRDNHEISIHTWNDYAAAVTLLVKTFGPLRPVQDLRPQDFRRLRAKMAKQWGPVRLGNVIKRIRGILKRANVDYGDDFNPPSKKTIDRDRYARGPNLFSAEEVRAMLTKATQPLKTMILLALNGGFNNSDVGNLPLTAINGAWLDYPRHKTGMPRRIPLWPETQAAMKEWLTIRPKPKSGNEHLVFVTQRGGSWCKQKSDSPVSKEMRKLLLAVKINDRRSFLTFRHTFQTVGDGARDQVATKFLMGHSDGSMSGRYREGVEDERLLAVVNHVRRWLSGETASVLDEKKRVC